MDKETFELSKALIEEISTYLSYRPFREAAPLIQKINQELQPQVQAPPLKESKKDSK